MQGNEAGPGNVRIGKLVLRLIKLSSSLSVRFKSSGTKLK